MVGWLQNLMSWAVIGELNYELNQASRSLQPISPRASNWPVDRAFCHFLQVIEHFQWHKSSLPPLHGTLTSAMCLVGSCDDETGKPAFTDWVRGLPQWPQPRAMSLLTWTWAFNQIALRILDLIYSTVNGGSLMQFKRQTFLRLLESGRSRASPWWAQLLWALQ